MNIKDTVQLSNLYVEMYKMLEEKIILTKYKDNSGRIYFVVVSDLEKETDRSKETYINKEKIGKSGLFTFDKSNLRKWISKQSFTSDEDFAKAIPIYKAELNKIQQQDGESDEISDYAEVGMKDKIINFLSDLKNKIRTDSESPEIKAFFDFRNKFRRYSLNNQILIFMQNPNATRVAGKVAWSKLNRKLKLGAKGIHIFVPINAKDRENAMEPKSNEQTTTSSENTNVDEIKYYTRFILKPVFDIADTEVMAGKEDLVVDEPKWFDDSEVDDKTMVVYNALESLAKHENIKVDINSSLSDGARGVSKVGSIELLGKNISTFVHEIAHELLHTLEDRMKFDSQIKELEAEGVAYTVLRALDLPAEHASKYLALWKIDPENVTKYEKRISTLALFILNYIEIFASGGEEEANNFAENEERKWASSGMVKESFKKFFEKNYRY